MLETADSAGCFRIADHVVVEPLVCSWPAWWCNVAPVSGAFHGARYQLSALRSYLRNPKLHLSAARDPRLAGGPFVDIPEEHAPAVLALLARMESSYADAGEFVTALATFSDRLLAEAKGQSLESFYGELPPALRGLVELVYDYYNRPSVRVDEGLVYTTDLYKRSLQSLRLWTLERDTDRRFYMSTPRVPSEAELDWPISFADPRVSQLFALDVEPQPMKRIIEIFEPSFSASQLAPFFDEGSPRVAAPWTESRVRVRYMGHACVLVQSGGTSIIVDPFVGIVPRSMAAKERFDFTDLPAHIDYALVTHGHSDHFAMETLVRLRPRIGTLVVPRHFGLVTGDVSLKRLAAELGYESVVELDTLETIELVDGLIVSAPFFGEHGDLMHGKATFLVRLGGEQMLFAADSTCLDVDVQRRLRKIFGDVTTVFMNTETEGAPLSWPFDSLFPKGRNKKLEESRRCRGSNLVEGIALLEALGARHLYNYAMGLEPWLERITGPASVIGAPRMVASDQLLVEARARGIQAVRLSGSTDFFLESDHGAR